AYPGRAHLVCAGGGRGVCTAGAHHRAAAAGQRAYRGVGMAPPERGYSNQLSARRAACDLVIAVAERGQTLEDAMAHAPHFAGLEGGDRAFARAIASATLRHLGGIDSVLAQFLAKPLPQSAPAARALLRTGAAQILILETPAHAAVSESVALANAHQGLRG